MSESENRQPSGGTRWRRFAAMMVPATVVAGGIVLGMANGAIAASFAVSGQTFKVGATKLEGNGFKQYGGMVEEKNGTKHPVAVSEIADAKLYDLCQSVNASLPGIPIVLTINAGGDGKPATATNLLIDMDSLAGDATFENIQIGRDANDLNAKQGQPGGFGQSADKVTITKLEQVARSTSAGVFTLNGLKLKVNVGKDAKECF
ncbi:cholesterol esterase [Micromonospora sp. AKA38]|nr:cholesterol esterase [Micromonospora sp. AKA38]